MITDFRINSKGELEGKVIPPAKWEEMYTKDEVGAMLEELLEEFEKLDPNPELSTYYTAIDDCSNLTQQKIDKLKENTDGNK